MTLFLLLAAHFLCDYPLQGDFLARGKNHVSPLPGIPWFQCLLAHAFIHAGAVALITGSVSLGLFELMAHTLIDHGKCAGTWGYNVDQSLHWACKLTWWALWHWGMVR